MNRLCLNGDDWTLTGWWRHQWKLTATMETDMAIPATIATIPATVPGAVQCDLIQAGLMDDPFYGDDSLKGEWINLRDWTLCKEFEVPADFQGWGKRCVLHFGGLDFCGQIQLNNVKIREFWGMFEPVDIDVTDQLRYGEKNHLRVLFTFSPEVDGQYGFTSKIDIPKSRFNYVWDWCPRIVPVGIWEDVWLESYVRARLTDYYPKAVPTSEHTGRLETTAELDCADAGIYTAECILSDGDKIVAHESAKFACEVGKNDLALSMDCGDIELWWPRGEGEQKLYDACIRIVTANGVVCQEQHKRVGFRTVKFVSNQDSPEGARPYTMQVNGRNIFLHGVNWVPYLPYYGATRREGYENYLTRFADMNCNILRVWGGAILEKEDFYDLCDEYGLLVWQEFNQSSSGIDNYPNSDPVWIERLEKVSAHYIRAKRSHACHAVWCGGNELLDAYSVPADETHPNLKMLKELCDALDPDACFLPCSASGPTFCATDRFGEGVHHDNHGPWKYAGPKGQYDYYNNDDSLFRSEVGTQSVNRIETLEKYKGRYDVWPPDLSNRYWLHRAAWWTQRDEMTAWFGPWSDEERDMVKYTALSQYLQWESLRYSSEATHRRWPQASGYIVWGGDEPFPNNANCNLIEQDGTPKPAYYALQNAFRPIHVSASYDKLYFTPGEEMRIGLYVTQFVQEPVAGTVKYELRNLWGEVLFGGSCNAKAECGVQALEEVRWTVGGHIPGGVFLLRMQMESNGTVVSTNQAIFTIAGDELPLGPLAALPKAQVEAVCKDGRLRLTNTGKEAAVGLFVYGTDPEAFLKASKNYLTLLPGEVADIELSTNGKETKVRLRGINADLIELD